MILPRPTSNDVARLAGVNQSTVSRVFSKKGSVAPETRARVLAAAEQLGYTPNAIARSLISQQTNIVGFLMANITNPFYPYVLEQFILALQAIDRQVLVFSAGPHQEIDDVLPVAMQYQVDALVVTSATFSSSHLSDFVRRGTPVVLFNRYIPIEHVHAICCDNVGGGRMVADFLLDAGHQRLAYIAGDANSSTNRDREQGFLNCLWERGAPKPICVPGQYSYESGCMGAERLLQRDDPPDAIFCANDLVALGAIDRARELCVRVPQDVAVVGFDDIPMASWSSYALTTVRQPVDQMIEATVQVLRQVLDEDSREQVVRMIPGEMIERRSARRIRTDPGQNVERICG